MRQGVDRMTTETLMRKLYESLGGGCQWNQGRDCFLMERFEIAYQAPRCWFLADKIFIPHHSIFLSDMPQPIF